MNLRQSFNHSKASPARTAVRGAALLPQCDGSVQWLPDAWLAWQDGRLCEVRAATADDRLVTQTATLYLPGLIDLHCHWPQSHVRGQFGGALLPWLREAIWPAEAAFADPQVAEERAKTFLNEILRAGTVGGLFFGPPNVQASALLLALAPPSFFDGPALMMRHAPAELLTPVAQMLAEMEELPADITKRLAVTPRFAPNVDADGLRACAEAMAKHGWPAQSHVSENLDEIKWVAELFPLAKSYLDVYAEAGLLGPHTVLAHGVHLGPKDWELLAQTGTWLAHCPTSNQALGSGRMPLEQAKAHGVRWVLATDVGAGPLLSQLDCMGALLQVHQGHCSVNACEALAHASAIPGEFLAQFDPDLKGLGQLAIGAPAHIIGVPRPAGDDAESVLQELLQTPRNLLESLPTQVFYAGHALLT